MAASITTEVQLCNIALGYVGQRQAIDSLDEDTTEAAACNTLYAACRDEVLCEHPWTFAKRRATLTVLEDETERAEWGFIYSLPSDFLVAHGIDCGDRLPPIDGRIPFAIEQRDFSGGATQGLCLLTDQEDAVLFYTAKITTVALYSPHFVKAVAWLLASELALMLPVEPQVGLAMKQGYSAALAKARALDSRQGWPDLDPESEFIRARS